MLARLSAKVILLAVAGSIVAAVLIALWLNIADSHVWQFVLSMLLGLAILLGVLWLKATILRLIRLGIIATPQSMGILAVWIVVGWALSQFIQTLSVHVVERAGFWNSRLSAHQRTLFTEPRLELWQNDAISTLLWFVLPALLLPVLIETVSGGGLKTVGSVYARWQLWLTIAVASISACWLSTKLTTWHPAESVRGEIISAILRLGCLYIVLLAIALITLSILSELLHRAAQTDNTTLP
jgi:hypothetical protein